jgi:hypothetical protein
VKRLERFVSVLVVAGSLAAIVVAGVAGCPATTTGTDGGVSSSQCQAPSACWVIGPQCDCVRANLAACKVCDPTTTTCECSAIVLDGGTVECTQPADVCIGRSPTVCPGRGARCLPAGSSCETVPDGGTQNPLASPPQLVAKPGTGGDGGAPPELEPRCPFVDDVCCPGQ